MAGRKKIVRLKEGSACEECPLRENTLYNFSTLFYGAFRLNLLFVQL
jgi:hypothetical protein